MRSKRITKCPHCNKDLYGPKGRPKSVDRVAVWQLHALGYPSKVIAKLVRCSQGSVWNILGEKLTWAHDFANKALEETK